MTPGRRAAGFSLVEATLSLVLVAGLLLSALHVTAAATTTRGHADQRLAAASLAHDLLAEALAVAYDDPEDGPVAGPSNGWSGPGWGPETGEAGGGFRTGYDDTDDFDGWSATPPRDADGTAVPGCEGLRRSVWVRHVDDADPGAEAAHDEGLKRVVVQVHRGNRLLAEAVGLRSRAASGGGG